MNLITSWYYSNYRELRTQSLPCIIIEIRDLTIRVFFYFGNPSLEGRREQRSSLYSCDASGEGDKLFIYHPWQQKLYFFSYLLIEKLSYHGQGQAILTKIFFSGLGSQEHISFHHMRCSFRPKQWYANKFFQSFVEELYDFSKWHCHHTKSSSY